MLKDTTDANYKVGQVWNYQTRAGEEGSTLMIVKTEHHPQLGNIIHISVEGLQIMSAHAPGGVAHTITHLPFAEDAITRSVTRQIGQQEESSDFFDGYAQWRQAFDAGQAGIWTVTVAECIDAMEQAINST